MGVLYAKVAGNWQPILSAGGAEGGGGDGVPLTRQINTTAPLQGGGALNNDLTLTVAPFTSATAGVVPASGGSGANFLSADGTWKAVPLDTAAGDARYVNVAGDTITGSLGVEGNLAVTGVLTASLGWASITNKPDPTVFVTLSGDVGGNSSAQLVDLASGSMTIVTAIQPNSVDLGVDTTGNYIATVAGTTNQINVTGSGGEGGAVTISAPQNIHPAATPTFGRLTLTQITGTSPMTVSSSTMVANLNTEYIGGKRLADLNTDYVNVTGDTVTGDLLFGAGLRQMLSLNALTMGIGTQSDGMYVRTTDGFFVYKGGTHVTVGPGTATELFRLNDTQITYKGGKVWHQNNDGALSGLDADLLDGQHAAEFAGLEMVEALLGDLWFQETYDVTTWDSGNDLATRPQPAALPAYRHGMYWIVKNAAEVGFITEDIAGVPVAARVMLVQGDWIIAIGPEGSPPGTDLTAAQITWQYLPYSTETYIKSQIMAHTEEADPHSSAGYLIAGLQRIYDTGGNLIDVGVRDADLLYSPLLHDHDVDIASMIFAHETALDPHPQYLHADLADLAYAPIDHNHDTVYELSGAVLAHEAKDNPHAQYLTVTNAAEQYSPDPHIHGEYAMATEVNLRFAELFNNVIEVFASDSAPSSRVFVGAGAPAAPRDGDLWVETPAQAIQVPTAATGFSASTRHLEGTFTSENLLVWNKWPVAFGVTAVSVYHSSVSGTPPGGWGTAIFTGTASDTGYTHVVPETSANWYWIVASNSQGTGAGQLVSRVAADGSPPPPATVTPVPTTTSVTINWAPVSGVDLPTNKYKIYKDGEEVTATSAQTYTITPMLENTPVTVGVVVVDNAGNTSTPKTVTTSTLNAAPPAPTGLALSVSGTTLSAVWNAVTVADFNHYYYEVSGPGGTVTGTVGTPSKSLTALSAGVTYTFKVRSVDNMAATSAFTQNTIAMGGAPDVVPPLEPTITSFKPEVTYGALVARFSWPGDTTTMEIMYQIGTGAVQALYTGAPVASRSVVTVVAGKTVKVYARGRDIAGNWSKQSVAQYTVEATPTFIGADSTKSWRNGAVFSDHLYQGYTSNPALNSYAFWFYGTQIANTVGGKTISSARILLIREENIGGAGAYAVGLAPHGYKTPTELGATTPTYKATASDLGSLTKGEMEWVVIPPVWIQNMAGSTTWKGLGIFQADGAPYMALVSTQTNGYSGLIEVNHLG